MQALLVSTHALGRHKRIRTQFLLIFQAGELSTDDDATMLRAGSTCHCETSPSMQGLPSMMHLKGHLDALEPQRDTQTKLEQMELSMGPSNLDPTARGFLIGQPHVQPLTSSGRTYASRSCYGWDRHSCQMQPEGSHQP